MSTSKGLVIVANRLPVRRVKRGGASAWEASPGGLVSALSPILQKLKGTWVGWAGTSGTAPEAFTHIGIRQRPVSISPSELDHYYSGFCNATIWEVARRVLPGGKGICRKKPIFISARISRSTEGTS